MRQFSQYTNKNTRRIVEIILVDERHVFFIPKPSTDNFIHKGKVLTHNQFSEQYEPSKKGGCHV